MKTIISKQGDKFLINNKLIYSEIEKCPAKYHGMLMNMRMIQGVFDDKTDPTRFNRFGKVFDAQKNTDELIDSLQQWYDHGIRAMTVGFQGGGPCFTTDAMTIDNNPFSSDGLHMDEKYLARMKKLILAADEIGMVIIVSLFYGAQSRFLKDDNAVMNAVKTASNWLRDEKFTNVIIEIANEHNVGAFDIHPIIFVGDNVPTLIEIAKRESGGIMVGCSGVGGSEFESINKASDVIIIHGNDQTRNRLYYMIKRAKQTEELKPIIFNEDSQELSQLSITFSECVSWGYYNNMTKQEPPAYWGITKGEDEFFANRVAIELGIKEDTTTFEDKFYLQGLEPHMTTDGKRWIRLASQYPELILKVDFHRDGEFVGSSFEDPFPLNDRHSSNWQFDAFPEEIKTGEVWKAVVTLVDGRVVEKVTEVL